MCPLEFVATATDSPKYSPGGSFSKFGVVVNEISGTPSIVALIAAGPPRCPKRHAAPTNPSAPNIRCLRITLLIGYLFYAIWLSHVVQDGILRRIGNPRLSASCTLRERGIPGRRQNLPTCTDSKTPATRQTEYPDDLQSGSTHP